MHELHSEHRSLPHRSSGSSSGTRARGRVAIAFAVLFPATLAISPALRAGECEEAIDCVRVSVKHVLDGSGQRSEGHFSHDDEIRQAIDVANGVLGRVGARWRLSLEEIVDLDGASRFHDVHSRSDVRSLEALAEAKPTAYAWRNDAINIYLLNSLPAGGICAFPHRGDDIIVINNSRGIANLGVGWLHEVGHYLSLTHTFQCEGLFCDPTVCTGTGAYHDVPRGTVSCPDNCPDFTNVMSYYRFSPEVATLSACQLEEMEYELYDPDGRRRNVVGPPLEVPFPEVPREPFRRGDISGDSQVNLTDSVFLLRHLFAGGPAPVCLETADTNDDGALNLSDAVYLLNYLFADGAPPAEPWSACGVDPAAGSLGCFLYPPCLFSASAPSR